MSDATAPIDRTSALGLFNTARSFWRSAEQLKAAPPKVTHPQAPQTFLFCHSIELYLKSYLRGSGLDVDGLKRLGHRVAALGNAARERGLTFSPEHIELLSHIQEADIAIEARYIVTGFKQQPTMDALSGLAKALDDQICSSLAGRGFPVHHEQFAAPPNRSEETEPDAQVRRERSVRNLRLLHDREEEALHWIYHATAGRARASINHTGIRGLHDHGILVVEDKKGVWTDLIFLIPPHIMEVLQRIWGDPTPSKVDKRPPWERQRI